MKNQQIGSYITCYGNGVSAQITDNGLDISAIATCGYEADFPMAYGAMQSHVSQAELAHSNAEESFGMRRVFVIRKDLNLQPGKLAAMVGHMCEAYWTNMLKRCISPWKKENDLGQQLCYVCNLELPVDMTDNYLFGTFTKTICECKNKEALHKADDVINELGLKEGIDFGYINDSCKTDLTPENPDGTCTVGMWFKPLPDSIAHKISKKFKLYGAFDKWPTLAN